MLHTLSHLLQTNNKHMVCAPCDVSWPAEACVLPLVAAPVCIVIMQQRAGPGTTTRA